MAVRGCQPPPVVARGATPAISTRNGGGYYGYKIHAAVCTRTGLPLAWEVRTAREAEVNFAVPLLDAVVERGFVPGTVACDKGYDSGAIHAAFELRDCRPVIPLRKAPPKATTPATILARPAQALARARVVPLAA